MVDASEADCNGVSLFVKLRDMPYVQLGLDVSS